MTITALVDRPAVVRVHLYNADLDRITASRYGYVGDYTEREVNGLEHGEIAAMVALATKGTYEQCLNPQLADLFLVRPYNGPEFAYAEVTAVVHQPDTWAEVRTIRKLYRLVCVRPATGVYTAAYSLIAE